MHVSYIDVISRIDEEPTWWDDNGYPRYGEFDPHELNVYADHVILVEIECQACAKKFLVGRAYTRYDLIEVRLDVDFIETYFTAQGKFNVHTMKVLRDNDGWIPLANLGYSKIVDNPDNSKNPDPRYRTRTIEDTVKNFGFGDPPSHGCVGDTMGCVELRTVEVWDMRHGQVVENNLIKKSGAPARIPELENYDLRPPWAKDADH